MTRFDDEPVDLDALDDCELQNYESQLRDAFFHLQRSGPAQFRLGFESRSGSPELRQAHARWQAAGAALTRRGLSPRLRPEGR